MIKRFCFFYFCDAESKISSNNTTRSNNSGHTSCCTLVFDISFFPPWFLTVVNKVTFIFLCTFSRVSPAFYFSPEAGVWSPVGDKS
jgi:hypothetical protein